MAHYTILFAGIPLATWILWTAALIYFLVLLRRYGRHIFSMTQKCLKASFTFNKFSGFKGISRDFLPKIESRDDSLNSQKIKHDKRSLGQKVSDYLNAKDGQKEILSLSKEEFSKAFRKHVEDFFASEMGSKTLYSLDVRPPDEINLNAGDFYRLKFVDERWVVQPRE